jgi:5-bromo-4-chloroindolyl phosphate hydrolysis protein
VGDREFIPVRELASKLAVDEKKLLKKLKKMLMKGMLPGARLDENDTTLILTQDAIEQYEQMMKAQKERMEEQKLRTIDASSVSGNEAAQKVLEEGNSYLIRVREINDKIAESDPMSDKLYKLEEIMRRIFEQVSEHPEKSQDLRKFMNYYLPTTEKLLQAYVKLDSQPNVVNVKETKRQISEALDTINVAFENLLDDLFQEQAWDISSDISVMNSMMQQDGLVQGQGRMQAMTREDGFGN